jgi:hypothetical protein
MKGTKRRERSNASEAINTGLLGELEVEAALVRRGWHPVRLDRMQVSANVDIIAVKGQQKVAIQVKAGSGWGHSHAKYLHLGRALSYLRDGKSVFNSKVSPLISDVVIAVVCGKEAGSRFVVMPIAFAETIARAHADYWYRVATRTESGQRTDRFPIYVNLFAEPKAHGKHHMRMARNAARFEDRWDILEQPLDRLHKTAAWPLDE